MGIPAPAPATPAPAPAAPAALDELMLAMDIVDTLRHDESLAAHALGDAEREQALVAQVRSTYAAQGIAVSERIVEDAVASLRERRFHYQAPPPSLQVRLARAYVSRRRWAPRLLAGVALLAVLALGAHALGSRIDAWRFQRVHAQAAQLQQRHGAIEQRVDALLQQVQALPAGAALVGGHDAASTQLQQVQQRLAALPVELATAGAESARLLRQQWEDDGVALDRRMQAAAAALDAAARDTDAVAAGIESATELASRQQQVAAALARIVAMEDLPAGVADRARRLAAEFEAALAAADANAARAAQQALEALAQRSAQRLATTIEGLPAAHRSSAAAHLAAMDAALLAADPDAFDRAAAALDALATTLAADYTLRIVNRPGARSGVWRYPEGNRAARNYYIIVDAIGSDGAPVAIPVRNEETGQVTRAATFGIRVPQAVFERVRADKQDNGLVDQDQFGRKRPGVLEPEYAHEVAGGMITDWSD